jgi:hypothetical protein
VRLLDEAFRVQQPSGDLKSRPWFPVVASVFERWSALGGVRFVYQAMDDGAPLGAPGELGSRGDVRLAATPIDGTSRTIALGRLPDDGDVLLDSAETLLAGDTRVDHLPLRNVLAHELGHVLGLGHVSSAGSVILMEPELSLAADGPQIDDVRGLHRLYGDRYEGHGNDTRQSATPIGSLAAGGSIALGGDASTPLVGAGDLVSIDGLDDRDFYAIDLVSPGLLTIELTPRGGVYWQSFEPGQVESPIDANASNNLNLALWADGASVPLRVEEGQRRGLVEQITALPVEAGRYTVEVLGVNDAVQLYELRVALASLEVPEPPSANGFVLMAQLAPVAVTRRRR